MPNVHPNPSYEVNLDYWEEANTGNPSMTRITTDAWHGTACLEVVQDVAGPGTVFVRSPLNGSNDIPVTSGNTVSIGIYGKWVSGTPKSFRCDLRWLNGLTTESATQPSLPSAVTMNTSTWAQCKVEGAVAPADAIGVRLRIAVLNAVAGDTFRLDGAQVEFSATLPAFDTGAVATWGSRGYEIRVGL